MNNVYPSVQEIMPPVLLSRIPATLAKDIEERYLTLGEKYLTEELTVDGRRVNACMHNDSVQDAIEEVVDAVFNICVWIFKSMRPEQIEDFGYPENAYACLTGLIEIYSLLAAEREARVPV